MLLRTKTYKAEYARVSTEAGLTLTSSSLTQNIFTEAHYYVQRKLLELNKQTGNLGRWRGSDFLICEKYRLYMYVQSRG